MGTPLACPTAYSVGLLAIAAAALAVIALGVLVYSILRISKPVEPRQRVHEPLDDIPRSRHRGDA